MSKKVLTKEDISKITRINLFWFSNDWYSILYATTIFVYAYSFLYPWYGWRRKPINIPQNTEEYISAINDMQVFFLPLVVLSILNLLIKKIEILQGYKTEKKATVIVKLKIFKQFRIIIFNSYNLLFFSNNFKYNDLKSNDKVVIETTYFGRFINYKRENKT